MVTAAGMRHTPTSQAKFSGTFLSLWGPELYVSCPYWFLDPALIDAYLGFFTYLV